MAFTKLSLSQSHPPHPQPHHAHPPPLHLDAAACLSKYFLYAASAAGLRLSALAFQNSSSTAFCAALLWLYLK